MQTVAVNYQHINISVGGEYFNYFIPTNDTHGIVY